MTQLVRVANAGIKVAGFSMGCEESVPFARTLGKRVAGKGLGRQQLKVDPSSTLRARSLKMKEERFGKTRFKTEGLRLEFFADAWEVPPPPVFFVRVADKGLTLDAASRASIFGELNAETQSARRAEKGMGTDLEVGAPSEFTAGRVNGAGRLATISSFLRVNMRYYTTIVTDCQ